MCLNKKGDLQYFVAEVNNTFNEKHVYLLESENQSPVSGKLLYQTAKKFYVSPFNDVSGEYKFLVTNPRDKLDIRIQLLLGEKLIFHASMIASSSCPMTTRNLLKTIVRYPFEKWKTLPRIYWQALKLHFQKKMPFVPNPILKDPMTIRISPPTVLQQLYLSLLKRVFSKFNRGTLLIILPDNSSFNIGSQGPQAVLHVYSYNFFSRLVNHGDIGLGESFMLGEWGTNDIVGFISLLIVNMDSFQSKALGTFFSKFLHNWREWRRRSSLKNSKKNISFHYDLSNQLYKQFLDPSLTYSCALFKYPDDSLEQAQLNKLDAMIQKAALSETDHLLEIGCGWGSFAIRAVKTTGCRVTAISLSKEQLEYAQERVNEEGLQDKIVLKLCDFRHLNGQFDKIVSIEMFEALGERYWGDFFQCCDRLLKPLGVFALQTITMCDQRFPAYSKSSCWIHKHIFPGGQLPSLTALSASITKHSSFVIDSIENIGVNYARTLHHWRDRFLQNQTEIANLGFNTEFLRKWEYYLAFCEASFQTRYLGDLQLVLTRPETDQHRRFTDIFADKTLTAKACQK